MNPVNVDRDMLTTYLEEDSDYQEHPYRVYLNRGNGELLSIYEDEEEVENMFGISAEETRNLRREVENNPEVYLDFPVPGHAQWHEWFQEFLEQRDRSEEYFGASEAGSNSTQARKIIAIGRTSNPVALFAMQ